MSDFPEPTTSAARAASEVATNYLSESLLNHSIRSWYWAVGFAALEGRLQFDAELLYVSAILHDAGLAEEFDNHTISYEHAAGHLAWALTAGAGWTPERRTRALEIIVRHNWAEVDPDQDIEGYLLEIATGLDISGSRPGLLPLEFQREVLAAYPRRDLAAEFGSCVTEQAARKPTTSSSRLIAGGLIRKLRDNPLETIGQ